MKVSLNSIRIVNGMYGSAGDPAPDGIDGLVQKIGAQLGAVEEVTPYGDRFKGVLVIKVMSCKGHPDADRLHVCKVDDGGKAEGVERDENGYVQVVCGAPNVREGLVAAWLPPGTTVPSTYYDVDSFVLGVRPLRGVVSNGMLASPKELTIGDSHEGILELDTDAVPGTPFTEAYQLEGDVVIDMENKMFTHRPDCFGQLGIARELEGIQRRPYKSPDWYSPAPSFPGIETDELRLEVRNEIPELVPRFTAITMRGVTVKPSPVWLQIALSRVGVRPINNIVDYTNFFMLETGQPLHAYDYDKVVAQDTGADHATIVVRKPGKEEKILLLNGKEITPGEHTIMIATKDKLIGAGGVMGGGDTEVDDSTKNIIIECANFDMYSIRRTSMEHGLFTDAVTRFNKGQSPLQNLAVLAKIVDEIRRFAGGKVASAVIDDNHLPAEMLERGSVHPPVTLSRSFINTRLGFELSTAEIAELLTNVECNVEVDGDELTVKAPFWRTDIAIPEDIVEEVGRLYGFDHLPLELPRRDLTPAVQDASVELKARVRDRLAKLGANEVLSYTFVHGNLLDKAGQDRSLAFQLSNALSPDLQYYRLSLTPSLLEKVHPNIKAGYDSFALFEINKIHGISESDEEGLPKEFDRVGLVFAAEDRAAADRYAGAPYYQARAYLASLLAAFGLGERFTLKPLMDRASALEGHKLAEQMIRPFEPTRSACVYINERLAGVVGEYRRPVQKNFKLPGFTAGFELWIDALAGQKGKVYERMSRFPSVTQDITLKVPSSVAFGTVYSFIAEYLRTYKKEDNHFAHLKALDIYQRPEDERKNLTFRVVTGSYERTLTDDEVNSLLDQVGAAAKDAFGAERV
ncbi:MAG TPA: phenylalanine--tRNA ligase subunit beta [Candidatus Saccharimonadales bacterium]|nr:phenylalanine--tRNA ligase subunit beta [Candidatus Saccharimonadales bacterium]